MMAAALEASGAPARDVDGAHVPLSRGALKQTRAVGEPGRSSAQINRKSG